MASPGLPGCRELLLGPLGRFVRVIRPCNLRLPKKKKKKKPQDAQCHTQSFHFEVAAS